MRSQNLGNNLLKESLKLKNDTIFNQNKYYYFYYILKKNVNKTINLNEFTIYFLKKSPRSEILINDKKINIEQGDCINFFNSKKVTISSLKNHTQILVAGVKNKITGKYLFNKIKKNKIYTVNKPWGYEKWLNGRGKFYAFKNIFLKYGFKTSLQYHNYKMETNFLYKGNAELVFKKNKKIKNLNVEEKDLGKKKIKSQSLIFVKPKVLHRIKANSDLILFETSTPHLDDVIRVSDDRNRSSGLIRSEHKDN